MAGVEGFLCGPIWTHGQWQPQGKEHNSQGVIELSPENTLLLARTMFLQDSTLHKSTFEHVFKIRKILAGLQ
jgi:hypothetical protein